MFYHRVRLLIPHPVELVMMVPKPHPNLAQGRSPLVALNQVYKVLVAGTCTYQNFHTKVKTRLDAKRHKRTMLVGEDVQVMIRLEAATLGTTSLLVLSCSAVLEAMLACKAPPLHIKAMEVMKLRSISMECLPIPSHVMTPTLEALPAPPSEYKVVGALPTQLPSYQLPAHVRKVYGLMATKPSIAQTHPLHHQLSQLQAWCTNPIQLDRPGAAHSPSTFQSHANNISLFLGHCHWFQGVAKPCLRAYLDPLKVCDYISMKVALEHSTHTICSVLDTAVMVLKWFTSLPLGKDPSLPQAIKWLLTLSTQVSLVPKHSHYTYMCALYPCGKAYLPTYTQLPLSCTQAVCDDM